MDEYRERVRKLILAKGTYKAASLACGMSETYFNQFVKRGHPKILAENVRRDLARYLGIDEGALMPPQVWNQPRRDGMVDKVLTIPPTRMPGAAFGERDLPIVGAPIAGRRGDIELRSTGAYVSRPEHLQSVEQGYALYVRDSRMQPAAWPGQLAYVDPTKPPLINGLVVVRFTDGTAAIWAYLGAGLDVYSFRQYEPREDIQVPRVDVEKIEKIVLVGDAT